MKQARILILLALAVFIALTLIADTPIAKSFWPWIIGLAGPIIRVAQLMFHKTNAGRTQGLSTDRK
jgi:hypothetical protein